LSRFATYFGDPTLVNEQVDRYRAVTAADVSAFARECLGPDNRAYLLYVPKAAPEEGAGELVGAEASA
jgi:predicted Zn-dependent peptidase